MDVELLELGEGEILAGAVVALTMGGIPFDAPVDRLIAVFPEVV